MKDINELTNQAFGDAPFQNKLRNEHDHIFPHSAERGQLIILDHKSPVEIFHNLRHLHFVKLFDK